MRIEAAGAVLWRPTDEGIEVAVIHRPRRDDWSLPKGKLDDGETPVEAALREVAEETGQTGRLGPALGSVRYSVHLHDGRSADKVVRFWAMEADGGTFTPNDEVDELRWLSPADALATLTYERERAVLERFLGRRAHGAA